MPARLAVLKLGACRGSVSEQVSRDAHGPLLPLGLDRVFAVDDRSSTANTRSRPSGSRGPCASRDTCSDTLPRQAPNLSTASRAGMILGLDQPRGVVRNSKARGEMSSQKTPREPLLSRRPGENPLVMVPG